MHAWVNGRLLDDPHGPAITVSDHGMTVGDGVFEAVKVVGGQPFALTRHLDRLRRSAAGLGLPYVDVEEVRRGVTAVLGEEHLPLGRLRITYTGGVAPLGSGRGDSPPTLVVVADTLKPAAATTSVVTVPWPRNERGALAGLKTTSYAENVVALAHAAERGATEAVFANTAGHLCEGTGSNVFYVVGGRAAHADPGQRLPGRHQPGPPARVVRRPRGRRAGRGAPGGRGDLPGLHDAGRAARHAVRRPGAGGPGARVREVPGGLGGTGGGGRRPLRGGRRGQGAAARCRSR